MKRLICRGVAALLLLACTVGPLARGTAAAGETTFRDLARKYFKDGDAKPLADVSGLSGDVKKVIALEYKVLLLADGQEKAVDPKTHQFKMGDQIRITVEPFADYYVYVYHIGASGRKGFLLPTEEEDPPLTKRDKRIPLPDDGFFEFEDPPGEETLLVVATEEPIADRAVLASVLTKKPGDTYTAQEEAVRKSVKATRKKVLKSTAETRKEIIDHTVMWRGIATKNAQERLTTDIRTRNVRSGTFEEPTADGTTAMYLSLDEENHPALLVNIPLMSIATQPPKP